MPKPTRSGAATKRTNCSIFDGAIALEGQPLHLQVHATVSLRSKQGPPNLRVNARHACNQTAIAGLEIRYEDLCHFLAPGEEDYTSLNSEEPRRQLLQHQ